MMVAQPNAEGTGSPMACKTPMKSSGPRASFAKPCCRKPNPMMSRSGTHTMPPARAVAKSKGGVEA